jgi:hypothetical protein
MVEKEKEDSTKKLEKEFSAFQVEWKKFLTNDFSHMTANIASLTADVGEIKQSMEIMLKTEGGMEQNMSTMLEATKRIVGLLDRGR